MLLGARSTGTLGGHFRVAFLRPARPALAESWLCPGDLAGVMTLFGSTTERPGVSFETDASEGPAGAGVAVEAVSSCET